MPLPVQTSERSFYNAEIIKESKARMGFLHKSRNGQTNIQQPLPKMQKQMQAKPQGIVVFCPKYKSKRGAKSVKNRREYDNICSPLLSTV